MRQENQGLPSCFQRQMHPPVRFLPTDEGRVQVSLVGKKGIKVMFEVVSLVASSVSILVLSQPDFTQLLPLNKLLCIMCNHLLPSDMTSFVVDSSVEKNAYLVSILFQTSFTFSFNQYLLNKCYAIHLRNKSISRIQKGSHASARVK